MKENNEDYAIITEVGMFGELNIEDPTAKDIAKKNKDIAKLIKESIESNKKLQD